jgi:hypothetical protein
MFPWRACGFARDWYREHCTERSSPFVPSSGSSADGSVGTHKESGVNDNTVEMAFYAVAGLCCLIAIGDWRQGVYAGILLDVLRDPVRKLSADQSVAITLAGAAVWAFVAWRAWDSEGMRLKALVRSHAQIRTILTCLVFALVPAAALSCVFYPRGYLLAAVGLLSYVGPVIGIGMGYLFARSDRDIYRLLTFYVIINTIILVGVPLEYLKYDFPGLGGVQHEWLRYRQGYTVDLIAGFYRSPDIMGLHAAHVVMFSAILWLQKRSGRNTAWIIPAVWAAFCVLLSGRRKMIGIPLVFFTSYIGLCIWRQSRHGKRLMGLAVLGGVLAVTAGLLLLEPEDIGEHAAYASTLFTEGPQRANEVVVGSTIETLRRVGILGAGLGSGTQGRHYIKAGRLRNNQGWQEDGVSRLFLEFGGPGALLVLFAVFLSFRLSVQAIKTIPPDHSLQVLQFGLASVVVGNAASFVISHQQYSGDPVSGLMAMMMAGIVLGLARMYQYSETNSQRAVVSRQLTAVSASHSGPRP